MGFSHFFEFFITLAPLFIIAFWGGVFYFLYRFLKVLNKFEKYLDKKLDEQ